MMEWNWKAGSVLNDDSPFVSCRDIFQAVCDEIGRYYEAKGFKYARSRPKLTYKDRDLKLEIAFWSSGHNTPGDYVLLEMIPSFYSLSVGQYQKEQGEAGKGYIVGHPAIFTEPLPGAAPGTVRVKQIFGDVLERHEAWRADCLMIHSNKCNVYGITLERFGRIIDFIDRQILVYLEILRDAGRLRQFLSAFGEQESGLPGPGMKHYLQMTFPDEIFFADGAG